MSPSTRKRPQGRARKQKARSKSPRAFEILPVEIRQSIAGYLDDKSITSYRLTCTSTKHALDEDEGSFWRTRFLDTYDPPQPQNMPTGERSVVNEWFKKQYQCRRHVEHQHLSFQVGNSQNEMACLSLMRDLINESFNISPWRSKQIDTHSRNMDRLEAIVKATGLLECVFLRPKSKKSIPNPVLLTIQLILSHLTLTAPSNSRISKSWGFSDSQTLVYTHNSVRPIFRGPNCQEIDIEWTLHVANFFKNHLLNQQELTHIRYDDLTTSERPQCWKKPISTATLKLGKHWKGSYAYVDHDELIHIRDGQNEHYPIPDHMSGDDTDQSFQNLCLDFPKEDPESWPALFERILKSRTKIQYHTATTRAQRRATGPGVLPPSEPVSFCFQGQGEDGNDSFLASGYFNPLPPQHGISGWHRMTMMKYWRDVDGDMDPSSLWAYEGVVLPGGMIMLGRWWHPTGDDAEYSGPFIFWNVDASMPVDDEKAPACN